MTSKPEPPSQDHLGFLDGIRGIAALWVTIGHCMIWGGSYWYRFPPAIIAVDVFMFVSGYLMVHQWTRRVGDGVVLTRAAVGEFWLRRIFRIVPVFWVALAATVLFHGPLSAGMQVLRAAKHDLGVVYDPALFAMDPVSLFLRATFLFGFMPKLAASPFMGDWSLALEMQFYAAFPFVLVGLRRLGAARLFFAAAIMAFATGEVLMRMPEFRAGAGTALPLPILLPMKLTVFLIGMVVAEANRRFSARPAEASLLVVLALMFAAMQAWQVAAVAALAFYLVAGRDLAGDFAGRKGSAWLGWIFGNRLMAWLADCSYAVYLLHSMAISLWGGWLWQQDRFLALRNPVRMVLLLVLVAATVYPLAWIIHQVVEKPGIGIGRRLAERWFPRPKRPDTAG